jgi:hypothetical protein
MFMPSRLRRELSVVVLLCTLSVFLFPGVAGPYSAVHGPVTALLALRQALKAFWSMARAALRRAPLLQMPQTLPAILASLLLLAPLPTAAPQHSLTVLRC